MNPITVTGQVNDKHLLSAQVPNSVPPGPVTIVVLPTKSEDDAGQSWMVGVAHQWTNELTDKRQDIYTLEDGEPWMRRNDIYLASFPFGNSAAAKLRPCLAISGALGSVPEVLVAYISSVIPHNLLPTDVVLDPESPMASSTRLKTTSVLRLHKLATIHTSALVRRLGIISKQN